MKTRNKIVSIICVLAMLFASFATFSVSISATEVVYDTPVDTTMWVEPDFETDHAYSFAFVGDTQYLCCGDYYKTQGQFSDSPSNTMYRLYNSIATTASERKLAHVFILGDITDLGYRNDYNLGSAHNTPIITGEWEIAKAAISQLDGVVPYSITRGNHDDYMIDDYFNVSEYTNQFTTNVSYSNSAYTGTYQKGGFYSDSDAKYTDIDGVNASRQPSNVTGEAKNSEAYVYWSATTGYHSTSMVNSWKTLNIAGTDYLFMTIDFNPTDDVLTWVNQTLAAYPNHKAIITTHSYLTGSGTVNSDDTGSTMYLFGNPGTVLWDEVLSQHENVFMVVSGHTGGVQLTYSYNEGVHGNQVLQVLVDPQAYDAKEAYWNHDENNSTANVYSIEHGTQDTGLVLYMNFSADGKKITFDYYSTLLNKFLKYNNHTIYLEGDETANDKDINLSNLGNGQVNTTLTSKTTKAPTLNGTIASGEYDFTRTTTAAASGFAYESDLKEYFSYDDDYVYYAFSIKQTDLTFYPDSNNDGVPDTFTAAEATTYNASNGTSYAEGDTKPKTVFWYQMNIKPNYDWVDKSTLSAIHYLRYVLQFRIDESGNVITGGTSSMIPPSCVDNSPNVSKGIWGDNIFISGSRSNYVNTFEIKISKDYLEINTPEHELQSMAYLLFLGYTSTSANANKTSTDTYQIWHRWDAGSTVLKAATGYGPWMYQYMIFVDDPIKTLDSGSVRISSTNSGLRFKSEVNTANLEYFKVNYKTVEIGTLIAPTDLLAGKALTHAIGSAGTDYIDVVAVVDKPFNEDTDGITTYAGSITNINENNLGRDFTAVGYIKLTDSNDNVTYYYSEHATVRNVSEIAEAALGDISATRTEDTETARGYDNALDGFFTGYYSKYTAGERNIITALIADTSKNDPFAPSPY